MHRPVFASGVGTWPLAYYGEVDGGMSSEKILKGAAMDLAYFR